MDEGMDTEPPTFEFEQLVEAKNCLQRILSVAEEQDEMIGGLAAAEQSTEGLDFTNCIGAFSMLRANASSNERLSSRVDKHMNELRERLMAQRNVSLNQRLALLTILTAIFMPLTLLTGIWGMNFENMPELRMEGAYYKALMGMFVLVLALVYCFHRAGWTGF
jgi:Mg2+ and Co2+ transporter CorA